MAGQALTPELALTHLDKLSADIRAAVLVGADGGVAASTDDGTRMAELAGQLFERAEKAGVTGDEPPSQVEVTTALGAVFAVRHGGWTLAVVTRRVALSSLMFYDLRSVLSQLDGSAA